MAFSYDRWTLANILPFVFVVWVIVAIWGIYVSMHLRVLMYENWDRFVVEASISQVCTILLLVSFARAVFTDPGSVPTSKEWSIGEGEEVAASDATAEPASAGGAVSPIRPLELKQTGERRQCKWCNHYKPDRTHHCRVCKSCILRMDHHCPWIVNCVGYRNHKYFFLLVLYSLATIVFILATQLEALARTLEVYTTPSHRFLLVFGQTLASVMCLLLSCFFSLHCYMVFNAMTTIELCEKKYLHTTPRSYKQGFFEDMKSTFGPVPLLWLLPCCPPDGDGLSYPSQKTVDLRASPEAPPSSASDALIPPAAEGERKRAATRCDHEDEPVAAQPEVTGARAANV